MSLVELQLQSKMQYNQTPSNSNSGLKGTLSDNPVYPNSNADSKRHSQHPPSGRRRRAVEEGLEALVARLEVDEPIANGREHGISA